MRLRTVWNLSSLWKRTHVIPSIATIAGDGAASFDKNPKWMEGKYAGIFEWDSAATKQQGALNEARNS